MFELYSLYLSRRHNEGRTWGCASDRHKIFKNSLQPYCASPSRKVLSTP